MASLNKVFLMGNLTRDPELRHTSNGMAVCEMGLAVSRRFVSNGQEKDEVCFIDILAWGRQGESCQRHIHKGDPVLIEGRLQLDQWQDKQTGTNRSKLRVVADRVQFLPRWDNSRGDGAHNDEVDTSNYDDNQDGGWEQSQPQSQPNRSGGGGWNNNGYQQQPPARQGFGGAPQQTQPKQGFGGAPQQQTQPKQGFGGAPPQMPGGAFDVEGAEDDIPF